MRPDNRFMPTGRRRVPCAVVYRILRSIRTSRLHRLALWAASSLVHCCSLLEAEVEFEHATKVAPVITEEVTIGLEETIKARILSRSGAFLCAAALFRNRRVKRVRHSGLHENETVATASLRWLGSSAAPSARCAALLWASLYSKHSMS